MNKKKQHDSMLSMGNLLAKYIVIDETNQAIVVWCDFYKEAETQAKDFAEMNDGHDIIIVKLSEAFRVYVPEEPQIEVRPMSLDEL